MSLYPGDPSPANAPAPSGTLPSQRGQSPVMGTSLTASPTSFLQRLTRPIEQKLGYGGSVAVLVLLAAAGVLTAGWLVYRLTRK